MIMSRRKNIVLSICVASSVLCVGCKNQIADRSDSAVLSTEHSAAYANSLYEVTGWSHFEVQVLDTPEGRWISISEHPTEHFDEFLTFLIHPDGRIEEVDAP